MFLNHLLVILTAAIFSLFTTPFAIRIAKKWGLVTDSKKNKHPAHTHKGVIPRAGGIPIFFSLLCGSLIFLQLDSLITRILIANFLLLIVGLLDDKYDLSPYLRFFFNLVISAIVVSGGLGIPFISNPFGEVFRLDQFVWKIELFNYEFSFLYLANLIAILWLTWMMNMVNWSKGVDGQLPGFVAITAFFLGILSQRFTAHNVEIEIVMILSFIIAGSYLGFLPFNFYPQKIMPGYGGGAMAGFLLGILSILSFGKFGTAILVLAIPIIDAIYALLRRIINKKSPFKGDREHFHHKLLEIGWGRRRIAVFYWSISIILGFASLFLSGLEKIFAFLTVAVIVMVFIFAIEKLKKMKY